MRKGNLIMFSVARFNDCWVVRSPDGEIVDVQHRKGNAKASAAALNANNTKTVKSLMSGKEVEIPLDTPLCCDPSSETYWSM